MARVAFLIALCWFHNVEAFITITGSAIGSSFRSASSECTGTGTGSDASTLHASSIAEEAVERRTLYDILDAKPDASYEELKKHYRNLARQTHPDAQCNLGSGIDTTAQFAEVADAWKTLSDKKERKRYDRSLKAEEIKESVEIAAQRAAPNVKKVMDVAFPFIRRTTVTAAASVSAAADGLMNGDEIGSAFVSGIKAGRAAGRVVDGMELFDKGIELEKRYASICPHHVTCYSL